jgi:hypothetical protein
LDNIILEIDDGDDLEMFDDSILPSTRRKKHKYDKIDWKKHLQGLEVAGVCPGKRLTSLLIF